MAETVKIGDIAKQLSTASRLVVSTDFFWVYMADGTQVRIPAEFVRAYLLGSMTFKGGTTGIMVSVDGGATWQELASYESIAPTLEPLIKQYELMTANEQERVTQESVRVSNEEKRLTAEEGRVTAENSRVTAETKRETDFKASKEASDDATAKALSTYSHPPYVDSDGYYYRWNIDTETYDKTTVNLTGKAFQIKKVFSSVAAMEATSVDTFDENDFILINTEDVEEEDNAKLYVVAVNESGKKYYSYLVDMSGFRGFTGKTPQMFVGTVTTLPAGSSASASVTSDGTDTDGNPKYLINLAIPKGDKVTLADFTDEEIAVLQKPANDAIALCDAATARANTATANADTATANAKTATKNAQDAADATNTTNATVTAQEAARVKAEDIRVASENQRIANENTRKENEATRQQSEETRTSNENARQKSETERQTSETARKESEKTRESNESTRQEYETTRQGNETEREKAEATRKDNETKRVSAEQERAKAEESRVKAEAVRASEENTRTESESQRIANETTRQTQEEQRETTIKQAKEACDTATKNADTATTESKEQTAIAKSYNENPSKIGDNGNWWTWNGKEYADTGYAARGGTLYPSFYHKGNKLYIHDVSETLSQYVKRKGNKVMFNIVIS